MNTNNAPHGMKDRLLSLRNTSFVQYAQMLYHKAPDSSLIQIDITPKRQSPYLPGAAQQLKSIPSGRVPYISPTDLVVFKVNSCGLRGQMIKKRTDARDAENLVEHVARSGPLALTDAQKALVQPCIEDMVKYGTKTGEWWRKALGMPTA